MRCLKMFQRGETSGKKKERMAKMKKQCSALNILLREMENKCVDPSSAVFIILQKSRISPLYLKALLYIYFISTAQQKV